MLYQHASVITDSIDDDPFESHTDKIAENPEITDCASEIKIYKLRHVEEELRRAEEKYRNIFNYAVEGIFQTTPDGYFISANPALADIFGYNSPEEMMETINNIDTQLYVDPEYRAKFTSLLRENNTTQQFTTQCYRKDGSIIWVSISARAVRDEEGNMLYYEGFLQDVTGQKKAEEEKERLIQALQEALSQVKTLQGLLPICASCKKIKNDKGYWEQIEVYIREHSEADFSHGICPECAEKLYPEYYKKRFR